MSVVIVCCIMGSLKLLLAFPEKSFWNNRELDTTNSLLCDESEKWTPLFDQYISWPLFWELVFGSDLQFWSPWCFCARLLVWVLVSVLQILCLESLFCRVLCLESDLQVLSLKSTVLCLDGYWKSGESLVIFLQGVNWFLMRKHLQTREGPGRNDLQTHGG